MVRLLATDPSVWGMAEQLLGEGNLRIPDGIRGIYCTLPYGDEPEKPTTCHVDGTSLSPRSCWIYRPRSSTGRWIHSLAQKPPKVLLRIPLAIQA